MLASSLRQPFFSASPTAVMMMMRPPSESDGQRPEQAEEGMARQRNQPTTTTKDKGQRRRRDEQQKQRRQRQRQTDEEGEGCITFTFTFTHRSIDHGVMIMHTAYRVSNCRPQRKLQT